MHSKQIIQYETRFAVDKVLMGVFIDARNDSLKQCHAGLANNISNILNRSDVTDPEKETQEAIQDFKNCCNSCFLAYEISTKYAEARTGA